jgi:hypothetical protein
VALIQEAIVGHLQSAAAVAAIVGTRVTWGAPDEDWESTAYITLSRIGHDHKRHMGGAVGLSRMAVQLDCWATTPSAATTLGEAVRLAMDNYQGTMNTDVDVHGALMQSEHDAMEESVEGTQPTIYRVIQEWDVWHEEAVS